MLKENVEILKGVGDKIKDDLESMGIYTIADLLFYFPYRYNFIELKPLKELIHEDQVTIVGKVIHSPTVTHYGRKKSRLVFHVQIDQMSVKAVMFNRTFAKKHLQPGVTVTLTGKWDAHRLQITVANYQLGEPKQNQNIESIYSVRGNISNFRLEKLLKQALEKYEQYVEEIIPVSYLKAYKLPFRKEAIRIMHFPKNKTELHHARRRFTYEELLLFQLKIQALKTKQQEAEQGNVQKYDTEQVKQFISKLPFELTEDQKKSLTDILRDLKSTYQMNRLLQGDVGSGKTAVATIALYASVTANHQGAFMVPTEILAEQHFHSLQQMFANEVNVALLTSSVKGKQRTEILKKLANNEIQIVIGTHSLIQEDVQFYNLGLIVIDEQHRFGVEQRRTLRKKGLHPDVLFMTATPIPRTLAITAFGDMDVSVIKQLPAGRKEVNTYWVKDNLFERVLQFIQKNISRGEQAYIVAPLIEESDAFEYQNAVDLYNQLLAYYPQEIEVGLLHGRLSIEEKEDIMKKFLNNQIHILVSTTVIEVGVDVPNATTMVIYDAERFGLSQLHQLRGRVGRGDKQSYCILIADPKGEVGKERMRIMTETNDGFRLSEADLELRGPGDFFGKKQSGIPDFKVADLVHDYRALEVAREDAEKMLRERLLWNNPAYRLLKEYIENEIALKGQLD